MKKQMKAIDLHARKPGDEHLVPGAAALVRFWLSPWGLSSWDPCQDAGTELPNASARLLLIKKCRGFTPSAFAMRQRVRTVGLRWPSSRPLTQARSTPIRPDRRLRTMRVPRRVVPPGRWRTNARRDRSAKQRGDHAARGQPRHGPFVTEGPWQTKPSPLPLRVG